MGTKSETLLGLSTQLFTAPSLLLHTGPTAVLTSALLALDRLLHYASDLHAVEVAARYDATAAAAELPPAAATGTGGVANTGEGPFAEGTIPPTPPGPRPISVTSAGVRAPQYPHSPHSASSTAPGAAGSPAEWSARPPPSGICAWNRAKSISAEPGACFDWFSGEPQAALEPTPMPKLICGHEALEKRRYAGREGGGACTGAREGGGNACYWRAVFWGGAAVATCGVYSACNVWSGIFLPREASY